MIAFLCTRQRWYEVPPGTKHRDVYERLGYESIEDAIAGGCVRLRDFGNHVAVQARSRHLCLKYLAEYLTDRSWPAKVSCEWAGAYREFTHDELPRLLSEA